MSSRSQNATMLAYDFYPSEGGLQAFMHSMVGADVGIAWTVLTRKADARLLIRGRRYSVVRTAMRPQLRIRDRLWLKSRRGQATLPEIIVFQTKRKLVSLGRRTNAGFLFADQLCSALSVRAAARLLRIPWGLAVYGKELLPEKPETRNLLSDADLVIACSAFARELAISRGACEDKTRVLHPAADTTFFTPPTDRDAAKKKFGVSGRKVLVTVAHLVPRKGHEFVIGALQPVRVVYPDVVYFIVGRGPSEDYLRNLARDLRVAEAVRFCGYVASSDLPRYYGAADIHIMPSTCSGDVEGFGISFIEAAACGTPSIGSRSGGIPDSIADGETGLLVEPGDVRAFRQQSCGC